MTRTQLDGYLRHGRWSPVLPRIYLTAAAEVTARHWIRASALWAGPDAVLLGVGALRWQRRTSANPTRIELATPTRLRDPRNVPVDRPAVVSRRLRIDEDWRIRWDGIWTVRTEYALVHGLPEVGPALLDDAVRRHGVDLPMVVDAATAMGSWPGSRRAAQILRAACDGAASEAERLLHRQLRRARITGWRGNVAVRLTAGVAAEIRVADVLFDDVPLIIEVDGFAFHTDHSRFQDDRHRQNLFVAAGWTVLRFTWQDLIERPDRVVATIRKTRRALQRDPG